MPYFLMLQSLINLAYLQSLLSNLKLTYWKSRNVGNGFGNDRVFLPKPMINLSLKTLLLQPTQYSLISSSLTHLLSLSIHPLPHLSFSLIFMEHTFKRIFICSLYHFMTWLFTIVYNKQYRKTDNISLRCLVYVNSSLFNHIV